MTPKAPVLAVRQLRTSFLSEGGWRSAVRDVSFEVAQGETVAIVGESGSGKSVTALSVMGLLQRATSRVEGEVLLRDENLLGLNERTMQRIRGNEIAMIFQEPMTSLNPVMSVGLQVAEALICHRPIGTDEARAEATRLLDRVRIPSASARFDDYPHQFSGGMRQRAMIAMALACRPKLLIADEPTTALDVTIQAQILDLIRELREEEGTSVLFITHDMGVVAEIADRTIVMLDGRIVESGETERVFEHAEEPYTRRLLAAVPRLGSMAGRTAPLRFPSYDPATSSFSEPSETPNTVVHAQRPLLDVRNLTVRFDTTDPRFPGGRGKVHAVENLSFSLRAGETLALVGESGCGKSTTGRSIMRLVEPDSGSILIDGQDILTLGKRELRDLRRNAQLIFQDPFASLNPRITVGAAIAEPLLVHRLAAPSEVGDRVASLLTRVGLDPELVRRLPHELSGGQRQRICIARALALDPKLIVADEAVSALDVSIKAQVVNLLLDLQASLGLGYLFISHDMAVVERVSHRVAVMYMGEIVEIGPRAAVFENPQHPYTKRLLAAITIPDPARRHQRRPVPQDEVRSPVHPLGHVPPLRTIREVAPGHLVQEWGDEWRAGLSRAA
ncbi:glutathione ABC transporter ATP-binding protein [Bosea sp. Root381]|nr:glutathione ABC transporter ATP-binding protein [Bosea sp. Root381]